MAWAILEREQLTKLEIAGTKILCLFESKEEAEEALDLFPTTDEKSGYRIEKVKVVYADD